MRSRTEAASLSTRPKPWAAGWTMAARRCKPSASQVLVSALVRRYGLGSLAHRAGSAVACGSAWHRVCVAVVALARYGHPLRFYITPHCPQCPPVAALKLRLVPVTASRPSGEGNRRYAKWPSLESVAQPSALPGRWHALRAAVCAPLWLLWRCGISQALRALFWPVACGQLSCVCPAHPVASPLRGFGPALVCPSAPKGLPQPSAWGHAA